jgi:hypothetical protein
MPCELFNEIVFKISMHDEYFLQRKNIVKYLGFTPLQKCVVSLGLLIFGVTPQELDNKYQITSSTGLKTICNFYQAIDFIYGKKALGSLT